MFICYTHLAEDSIKIQIKKKGDYGFFHKESMSELLEKLNDKQQEAVEYMAGPLLILAGAGSGKTRVLTYKIAYLLEKNIVKPWEILAITFTNKAAKEMKERVECLVGQVANDMWLGTFHSVCVRILKREIELVGYTRDFNIFDEIDKEKVIKEVMKKLIQLG